ncbi:lactonase family protein [Bacteroidota bacterium]
MKYSILILYLILTFKLQMCYSQPKEILYVGTFSERDSKGIYVFEFDRDNKIIELIQTIGGKVGPSFLDTDPKGNYLFSVNGTGIGDQKRWGSVTSYKINRKNGKLSKNNIVSAFGGGPCHIVIDKTGTRALVSNYGSGNLVMFPISNAGLLSEEAVTIQHNGSSVNESRQKKPRVHSIKLSYDNNYAYVSDLGIDKVMIYELDAEMGSLKPAQKPYVDIEQGSGPRHFAYHPDLPYAYVINELFNTVTAFKVDKQNGSLTTIQTITTLPKLFNEVSYCADIHIHPNGKFLYGSNRGNNTIVVFSIDQSTGELDLVDHTSTKGDWPRNFMIDQEGKLLLVANQKTDDIYIFEIDGETGKLKDSGVKLNVPAPVCLKILSLR